MSESLISLDPLDIESVFTEPVMDLTLKNIESIAKTAVFNVEFEEDRKAIASLAYKIAKTKTGIDAAGKLLVDDIKATAKVIDVQRKKSRDFLDALKVEVRSPLTEWEDREKARESALLDRLDALRNVINDIPNSISAIEKMIGRVDETDPLTFEEFENQAAAAKQHALEVLEVALVKTQQIEADAIALEELRKFKAAQEQIDRDAEISRRAAEDARIAAEAKAEADRREQAEIERRKQEAAHQASQDALALAEAESKAIADKIAAENAAVQAELEKRTQEAEAKLYEENAAMKRAEAKALEEKLNADHERQRLEQIEKDRIADKVHREAIEIEAINCLEKVLAEYIPHHPDLPSEIALAIRSGKIKNITINY